MDCVYFFCRVGCVGVESGVGFKFWLYYLLAGMILSRLRDFFVYLGSDSVYIIGLLWRFNGLVYVKGLGIGFVL